ncbi:MAG: hypothetical protein KAJ19_03545 [Gammaproteobacteria bacterium]|nr:hypothetical protein [Gammaproteobacteria bacterium]
MELDNYMLVYTGKILDGYSIEDVKKNMAEMIGKEQWKLEFLFSGKSCVIKSSMGLRAAMQYQGIFALTGALTEVVYRSQASPKACIKRHQDSSYGSLFQVMH